VSPRHRNPEVEKMQLKLDVDEIEQADIARQEPGGDNIKKFKERFTVNEPIGHLFKNNRPENLSFGT